MPIIEFTAGELPREVKDKLITQLTDVAAEITGIPKHLFFITINEKPDEDIAVGGVTSWQWWTAISRGDYKDGLIHVDDGASNGAGNADYCKNDGYIRDSKTLWALGNFSFFVKPGMVRVQIPSIDNTTELNNVMVTAYKDVANKKLVVVAVNISKSAKAYKLNLAGGTVTDNKLTPYITSEALSLKKGTAVDVSGFEIPARSVVTYVGTYK